VLRFGIIHKVSTAVGTLVLRRLSQGSIVSLFIVHSLPQLCSTFGTELGCTLYFSTTFGTVCLVGLLFSTTFRTELRRCGNCRTAFRTMLGVLSLGLFGRGILSLSNVSESTAQYTANIHSHTHADKCS